MNHNALNLLGANHQVISFALKKSPLILGRISKHFKDRYLVITTTHVLDARVSGKWIFESHDPSDYPTVGDFVLGEVKYEFMIIHELIPRMSSIERKVAGKTTERQILASNVDYIMICQSMNENFNLRRLERYISMAWSSSAIPVILLTKADLVDNIDTYITLASSVALGIDILTCSDQLPDGYKSIDEYLKPGKTYVFIGSSGVGKSTLINHFLDSEILQTNEVGYLSRGRHTTTSKSLFQTKTGAFLIDTPGMRELSLDQADLDTSFQDILEYALSCKFNDCTHHDEPGCAVRQKIEEGLLDPMRLFNYHKMQKELIYVKERQKYLDRQRAKNNKR